MPPRTDHSRRNLYIVFFCVALLAIVVGAMRWHSSWALRHESEEDSLRKVSIISAKKAPPLEELVLPGNVEAWHQATIYARTNGYVKRWLTPFGTHVHKGDVMAEIETPEVDAQLRQAEADLKTAQANNALAQVTAKRWKALLKTDSVSRQEADEKIADAHAKEAALASAAANRDHLHELAAFKIVRAPFDGIVSARLLDEGVLVNAGNINQQPLFNMVQSDKLRIYVKVPQDYSTRVNKDVVAELHFTEHPGEVFMAKFLKSAQAIDPVTRTLTIEFGENNKDFKLFAGGYTEVHIKLPSQAQSLRLPVNTLLFRSAGLQVATIDANDKVVLKKVVMGRDFGNEVELSSGLEANDRIIINPPDSIVEGQQVRPIEADKEDAKAADKKEKSGTNSSEKNDSKKATEKKTTREKEGKEEKNQP